jgi:SAM-dependent methyltransferase
MPPLWGMGDAMSEMERQYHEVANIFPLIEGSEFEELKQDIKRNGLMQSIWLHPDGRIIDGRNRYRACAAAGVTPHFQTWTGEGSLLDFVLSLNLHRRHLDSFQRACVAQNILPMLEAEAKARQLAVQNNNAGRAVPDKFPELEKGESRDKAAAAVKTNGRYVSEAKKLKETAPELFEQAIRGKISRKQAKRELNIRQRIEEKEAAQQAVVLPPTVTLRQGDFRELCADLPDASIDFILTDPPYLEEYLPLWDALGREAKRLLKPGGYLFAYSGQFFLPQIYNLLGRHLCYQWTAAVQHRNGHTRIWKHDLLNGWKPVLIYSNGNPSQKLRGMCDLVSGGQGDKSSHAWAQPEAEAAYYLEYMTLPGQTVLDPMMGSGTIPRVAHRMNRIAIGFELDVNHYRGAMESINGAGRSFQ